MTKNHHGEIVPPSHDGSGDDETPFTRWYSDPSKTDLKKHLFTLNSMQWSIIHLKSRNWKSIDKKVNLASKTQFQGGFHLLICKNQRSIITCWRSILTSALSSKFFWKSKKLNSWWNHIFFLCHWFLKSFKQSWGNFGKASSRN